LEDLVQFDDDMAALTKNWNDIEAFENAIAENPNEIAGFIAPPYHVPVFKDNEMPAAW